MLQKLCKQLAEEWEVEGEFATDVPGVWSIPLDEEEEVVVTEVEGGCMLSATLALVRTSQREDLFTTLMTANYLGQVTRGAVLAIDEEQRAALSQVLLYPLQPREFREAVEDFIGTFDKWKAVVLSYAGR